MQRHLSRTHIHKKCRRQYKTWQRLNRSRSPPTALKAKSAAWKDASLSLRILFATDRIANGKAVTAFCTATGKHFAAVSCFHSLAEAMLVNSFPVRRLVCSFHRFIFLLFLLFQFSVCKSSYFFWIYQSVVSFLPLSFVFFPICCNFAAQIRITLLH